jgi:monofunctional biosynthetic peptidoglycan transglycosylase
VTACYFAAALALAAMRWVNPPTTGVEIQRRIESFFSKGKYQKRRTYAPLSRISRDLQHAVVAAEDSRFYQHHGIDWHEVNEVVEDSIESGRVERGASTITQQLVKNLFFTTHRLALRKVVEITLAPLAELLLSKQRILELYLNTIEWGPGVYGAEEAARYHYGAPASAIHRDQATRLAAVIPAPRKRRPARMDRYSAIIDARMRQMGW